MATFTYDYPHPAVATDIAVFSLQEGRLVVLLIRRKISPYEGDWALPGGFLKEDEDIDDCARRELQEETGVRSALLHHFGNFSAPNRDPRGRVISIAYVALTPTMDHRIEAASDAADAQWHRLDDLPRLAFDHAAILADARAWLADVTGRLDSKFLAYLFALVPSRFTLTQLQEAYEAVVGESTDKRNFRRSVLDTGQLMETGEFERGSHRPAQLFAVRALSD